MSLTPDQRAMLQLLLERGQSYADLAGLLGGDEAGVRDRARAALTALAGRDPDGDVSLTDYLLGQADPIGRADAVRHLRDEPADLAMATELVEKLRVLAPGAALPRLPGEPRRTATRERRRPRRPLPGISRLRRPQTTLSGRQGRLLVGLASGAVLVIGAVLAVSGVFGGGEDAATTTTNPDVAEEGVRVTLTAARGSEASGSAIFATASGQQPYIEFDLSGLPAPEQGQAYVAWLMFNERAGHPLTPVQPDAGGGYRARVPLQGFQVPLAQRSRFVDVSLSDAVSLNELLQRALENTNPVIPYEGRSLLRGEIPRSGE